MNPTRMITAVGASVAVAAAAAGCGNSTSAQEPRSTASTTAPAAQPPTANTVTATISEWSVNTSSGRVAPGKVTFRVTNAGKLPHEFVILRTARTASKLGNGPRIGESGHVGEIPTFRPGATRTVTLDLKPGHYSLVCNLPSHYRMGMHADLTVG